jgi:hypothetical protein
MTHKASGSDPRATVDDLIELTEQNQWFNALDELGGAHSLERKWDIVEWLLLRGGATEVDIQRASLAGMPDVLSIDFESDEAPSEVWSRNRGLLTRIESRQMRSLRTNTADLAAVIGQDRADAFRDCATAEKANLLTNGPPDFQWRITGDGRKFLESS